MRYVFEYHRWMPNRVADHSSQDEKCSPDKCALCLTEKFCASQPNGKKNEENANMKKKIGRGSYKIVLFQLLCGDLLCKRKLSGGCEERETVLQVIPTVYKRQ